MPKFACIPPLDEAAPKFRGGFGELCSFIASAPCLIACRLVGLLSLASLAAFANRKKIARFASKLLTVWVPTVLFYVEELSELL